MFYRLKVLGNAMVTLPIPKRNSIHLAQPGLVKIKSSGSLGTKKPNWISRLSEWRRRCQAAAPSADTVARHRSRAGNDPSVSQSVFTITEKAPTRAFSWLKAPTSAFTLETISRVS